MYFLYSAYLRFKLSFPSEFQPEKGLASVDSTNQTTYKKLKIRIGSSISILIDNIKILSYLVRIDFS
ncbi:hypothetical protein DP117_24635 [Brasilonema sp. UFV-L1]|nr:hypothetical protein [Brasilonema sp. UFV-L1]